MSGVENIFVENPETHFQVLESMEGYWIGNYNLLLLTIIHNPHFIIHYLGMLLLSPNPNVITSYFRICSVRHYKAYWTIDFLQYNTWIFLFLFSNKVLDPIWKVYGLGFSKKSLDCENSWFSKTGILKSLLPFTWASWISISSQ